MRLEDHLAIEIDHEVAHWLGKQVIGVLNIVLVDRKVVCDEDPERVARPVSNCWR